MNAAIEISLSVLAWSMAKKLPADLATARKRLEKWRAGGRPRRPLPPELWEMAADLVPEHGIYRVSQVLRLEYYKVKDAVLNN